MSVEETIETLRGMLRESHEKEKLARLRGGARVDVEARVDAAYWWGRSKALSEAITLLSETKQVS